MCGSWPNSKYSGRGLTLTLTSRINNHNMNTSRMVQKYAIKMVQLRLPCIGGGVRRVTTTPAPSAPCTLAVAPSTTTRRTGWASSPALPSPNLTNQLIQSLFSGRKPRKLGHITTRINGIHKGKVTKQFEVRGKFL